jgi:cyanophycin synthetase
MQVKTDCHDLYYDRIMKNVKQFDALPWLTHHTVTLALDFSTPNNLDLAHLDQWLIEAIEINQDSLQATSTTDNNNGLVLARDLLSRVIFLARVLFRAGRIPLFDMPEIASVERRSTGTQSFRAKINFTLIDFIPGACYRLILQSSLELCNWVSQNALTDENRQKFFGAIEERVIKQLLRLAPAGKSTVPVLQVAHQLGIPFIHIGFGAYQLGWGSKARRMQRSSTDMDSAIGVTLAQNKETAANILRMAGLPAPVHAVVRNEADALAAANKLGFPVVLKPSDRDAGLGVTVDITDEQSLRAAFEKAKKLSRSKKVIVERQVPGVCHRLFIANGELLYAVKRLPMSVLGDGTRSITDLVNAEVRKQLKRPPWSRSEILHIDDLAIVAMKQAGFEPSSIPESGTLVPLRRIESTEWGGVDEDVSALIHPENLAIAIRSAELFSLHVAGIDIIARDISIPWYEDGAIVNEVNSAPLFGGGDISRRHIPIFFRNFIQGDGKIPIEVFAGSDNSAKKRQGALLKQGLRCYLTSANWTVDPQGIEVKFSFDGLRNRIRALICRPDVDAIIIASEEAEGDHPEKLLLL